MMHLSYMEAVTTAASGRFFQVDNDGVERGSDRSENESEWDRIMTCNPWH